MTANLRQRAAQRLTPENLDNADVGPVLQKMGEVIARLLTGKHRERG
jgi:hypothetical protein